MLSEQLMLLILFYFTV